MSYTIDVRAFTDSISDRALEQLCRENPELKFETDAKGKLIVISPSRFIRYFLVFLFSFFNQGSFMPK